MRCQSINDNFQCTNAGKMLLWIQNQCAKGIFFQSKKRNLMTRCIHMEGAFMNRSDGISIIVIDHTHMSLTCTNLIGQRLNGNFHLGNDKDLVFSNVFTVFTNSPAAFGIG